MIITNPKSIHQSVSPYTHISTTHSISHSSYPYKYSTIITIPSPTNKLPIHLYQPPQHTQHTQPIHISANMTRPQTTRNSHSNTYTYNINSNNKWMV